MTLIAISALAYVVAVGAHEHLGHTVACLTLGGRPTEIGAFYVHCDYAGMSDLGIRLAALVGPVVSLLIGVLSFLVLRRVPPRSSAATYFVWLLGTVGLMAATGYLLFSGISGIGDFGLTRDGVLYQAAPAWLWRIVLTIGGLAAYIRVAYAAARELARYLGGEAGARTRYARGLALTSYVTGVAVYAAIGALNPHGVSIVVTSALPASLGATSALLWMMQTLDRHPPVAAPPLAIERNWWWIGVGGVVTVLYALVLGPTLRP